MDTSANRTDTANASASCAIFSCASFSRMAVARGGIQLPESEQHDYPGRRAP